MFDNVLKFFKKFGKKEPEELSSKEMAKERLHLVLMQDRANVSADFLDMMRQEIIDIIKKYIDVDEKDIDVRLTNKMNDDGTTGAPALYANIPIAGIKNELKTSENILVTEKQVNTQEQEEKAGESDKKIENVNETEKTVDNMAIENNPEKMIAEDEITGEEINEEGATSEEKIEIDDSDEYDSNNVDSSESPKQDENGVNTQVKTKSKKNNKKDVKKKATKSSKSE